ncbi:hypothetical protein GCM10009610_70220 [Pseudonocardia xinjiangensis]
MYPDSSGRRSTSAETIRSTSRAPRPGGLVSGLDSTVVVIALLVVSRGAAGSAGAGLRQSHFPAIGREEPDPAAIRTDAGRPRITLFSATQGDRDNKLGWSSRNRDLTVTT